MKTSLFAFLLLFSLPLAAQEQSTGSITGSVVDAETLSPLIGVNILVQQTLTGDATDPEGGFSITGLKPGIYSLVIRYIGYESKTLTDIVVGANREQIIQVKLQPSLITGEEVTVTSGYFSSSPADGISKVSFSPEELRRSPGGAQDLGRVLNALPSVAAKGETSQDLLVRGGSPIENGNYIDNIPLPNVRHFLVPGGQSNGPLGIVNTELVDDIEFSAGGFGSSFGNHLSSVSDITYREGNSARLRGDVGLNMAGFTFNLDGPVTGSTTFLASARRSYLDIIADAINAGGAPSFADAQLKVVQTLGSRDKLTLLNIYGNSLFDSDLSDALDEGFPDAIRNRNIQNTTGLNWRHLWDNGYSNTSVSYSFRDQDQQLTDVLTASPSIDYNSNEAMAVLRSVSFLRLNERNGLEFGGELRLEMNEYDYFIASEINQAGQIRPDITRTDQINGSVASAFTTYEFQLSDRFRANAGVRADYTSYNEDLNLSPRIQASYALTERLDLRAAAGIFYQTLPGYLLSQNPDIAALRNTRADHLIAGLDYLLSSDTKLSVEVYNKQYRNAPILPGVNALADRGFILDNFQQFYDELNDTGEAYARGMEVLIQKKLAVDFYGMVSASFFRTRYRDYTGAWQDRLFDTRYLFSVIGGYRPNDLWEFSIRWTYQGGSVFTPVDPVASANSNTQILDIARFNQARFPAFHSMYGRFDRRFFLKRTNLVTFLEVWNLYNRANVEAEYWNIQTGLVDQATQFSLLPVGGVKFEF